MGDKSSCDWQKKHHETSPHFMCRDLVIMVIIFVGLCVQISFGYSYINIDINKVTCVDYDLRVVVGMEFIYVLFSPHGAFILITSA